MPFHFEQIPSTQTFLKELVQADPALPHLEYALADSQSQGIGRMQRNWVSDSGNLFLSIWIKNFSLPLTWIPHWIGVSLLQSLVELQIPSDTLALKWPNDLVVERKKKLAGIICEKVGDGVIVGIGVNLLSAPELPDRQTTCVRLMNPALALERMNIRLTEKLIEILNREPDLDALQKKYLTASVLRPGDLLRWVDLQTSNLGSGKFLRYGEFGELVAETEDGKLQRLYSEEIKLVF